MKPLLLLSTLLFINCIQSPGNNEPELIEKINKNNPEFFTGEGSITIDTLNLWEYEIWIAIFDYKGGGYGEYNTSKFGDLNTTCIRKELPKLYFNLSCMEEYYGDYAHLLEIQIKTRYTNQ